MPVVVFTAWCRALLGPPLSMLAASVALPACDRAVKLQALSRQLDEELPDRRPGR